MDKTICISNVFLDDVLFHLKVMYLFHPFTWWLHGSYIEKPVRTPKKPVGSLCSVNDQSHQAMGSRTSERQIMLVQPLVMPFSWARQFTHLKAFGKKNLSTQVCISMNIHPTREERYYTYSSRMEVKLCLLICLIFNLYLPLVRSRCKNPPLICLVI
jgi:hypothetical protein